MTKSAVVITGMPDTKRMRAVFQRTVFGLAQEAATSTKPFVVEALKPPPRVAYPIHWASEKQRRYVMAKLREQNNLPYRRTGALEAANRYYAVQSPDGATLILENTSLYAKYVYGGASAASARHQQAMHRNSGWPSMLKAKQEIHMRAMQVFRENFAQTLQAFGYFETGGKKVY